MEFDVRLAPGRREGRRKLRARRRSIGQLYRGSPPEPGKMGWKAQAGGFIAIVATGLRSIALSAVAFVASVGGSRLSALCLARNGFIGSASAIVAGARQWPICPDRRTPERKR
jgi:hypothetical protein